MNEPIKCMLATRGVSTDVNGSWRPCCKYDQPESQVKHIMPWMSPSNTIDQLYNSYQMQALRQDLANGIRVPECRSCWDEEDAGIESYRQLMTKKYTDIGIEVDSHRTISSPPLYLDLKLSNVCNLMCRMCGPQASSMIGKEWEKMYPKGSFKNDPYWSQAKIVGTENEEDFIKWLPHVKDISITGGDPFVGKENKDIIKLMIDSGYAKNIQLQFNTNGMLMTDSMLDMLKEFKYVSIAFSIDDIGKKLEYLRHGSDWQKIINNWNKVNYSNMKKHIYMTVCSYNVWYFNEAYEELNKLTNNISYDFVRGPEELNISMLNKVIKEEIIEKYSNNSKYERLVKFISIDHGKDLTGRFYKHIREYDKFRNEDFTETYPEWSEILMYG